MEEIGDTVLRFMTTVSVAKLLEAYPGKNLLDAPIIDSVINLEGIDFRVLSFETDSEMGPLATIYVEPSSPRKTVNDWCAEVHGYAKEKGWWQGTPRTPLEIHMLCVSEIAESTEEVRNGKPDVYVNTADGPVAIERVCQESFTYTDGSNQPILMKPEGEAIELADCVIRIMDYFGHKGWDMEEILKAKHAYNKLRPYRHGGKAL